MPLQKRVISLPFTKGVDTKTDQKLSAKPSRLENFIFKGGSVVKRPGSTTLTTTIDTGGSFTSGEAIFPFNSELVRLTGGKAYALGQQQNKWITKTGMGPVATHTNKRIVRKTVNVSDMDHASVNGVTVSVWVEPSTAPSPGVHVLAYDEVTGSIYQTGATAISGTANYAGPRCVVLATKVLIFCFDNASNLGVLVVNTATPETAPTLSIIETDFTTSTGVMPMDAVAYGGYAIVVYIDTSDHFQAITVNSSGTVRSSPAKTDLGAISTTGGDNNSSVAIAVSTVPALHIVNYGIGAQFLAIDPASFSIFTHLTVITATTANAFAALVATPADHVTAFFSSQGGTIGGATSVAKFISTAVMDVNQVSTAYAAIPAMAGMVIQTTGFVFNSSACCCILSDTALNGAIALQPTAWVIDSTGNVLAKILPALSAVQGGYRTCGTFTTSTGATALQVAERGILSYTSTAGTIIDTTPHGVTRVNLQPTTANQVTALQLGLSVYVGGSMPKVYDGEEIVEAGHTIFPEGVTVSLGSSGALSAGQYQWRVLYSWINAQGELQRSAVSPAVTATATATQKATLTIPTQRLCGRDAAGISKTQIEVYRTEANGINFYRVSSVNAPTYNNTSANTVTFTDDTVTDGALISNELLYTTGGVLDNIAPPAYQFACSHKTRLVIGGLDDPFEWRSSSEAIFGQMLRFNESWGCRVPAATGPITGFASMDSTLFIFTTGAAYVVTGDGPDLLGNNNWLPAQLIPSVTSGAVSWQSIVVSPEGIFFQSQRGLMLLDRSLGCEYVGADVEAFGTEIVRSAIVRPELSQVWWLLDEGTDIPGQLQGTLVTSNGGTALVWDYFYRQWSDLPIYGGRSACYYQGNYCRQGSNGTLYREVPTTWQDGTTQYNTVLETEWIKIAGLQGFQRIWRALVLGTYGGPFTLTWDAAYDYEPTYASADTTTTTVTGGYSIGDEYQLRRHLRVQKCEAVKFRFTVTPLGGTAQGLSLTDLSLEVGVKYGAFKLPSSLST